MFYQRLQNGASNCQSLIVEGWQDAGDFDDEVDRLIENARKAQEANKRVDIVFYFAGHGLADAGNNYLLPADFPGGDLPSSRRIKREAILLTDLIVSLSSSSDRLIVMLDACRDDPFNSEHVRAVNPNRSVFAGMAEIRVVPIGTQVFYCAGIKQKVS